ncbi:MAG: polysaccharide deacetylase family protein [Bacillota bacterium]
MRKKYLLGIGILIIIILTLFFLVDNLNFAGENLPQKNNKTEKNEEINEKSEAEVPKNENKNHIEKPEKELKDLREIMEEQALKYPDTFFVKGPDLKKRIALTFDDGPDKVNTPKILDILAKNNVRATFFLLGENVERHPKIAKRIKNEGHQIGNHSWSHPNFREMESNIVIDKEIIPTSERINKATGEFPRLLRPPFGAINDQTIEILKEKNWKIVNWSIDSYDWNIPQSNYYEIVNRIQRLHHLGGIILLHNNINNKSTVKALPKLIEFLKEENYEFNIIDELIY